MTKAEILLAVTSLIFAFTTWQAHRSAMFWHEKFMDSIFRLDRHASPTVARESDET